MMENIINTTGQSIGYETMCGRTFVGWYTKKTAGNPHPEYGCWYGEKEDPVEAKKIHSLVMVSEEFEEKKLPTGAGSFIQSGARSGSGHRLRTRDNFRVYHASQFAEGKMPSFAEIRAEEAKGKVSTGGEMDVTVDAAGNLKQQPDVLLKGSLVEQDVHELPAPMSKHQDFPASFVENESCNLDSKAGGENE